MTKQINKNPETHEEMVSQALNEQGFLFSQRVREVIRDVNRNGQAQGAWAYEANEYPVTAANEAQTRIDIVLRNIKRRGVYAAIECKRANPDYKKWIFFDKDYGVGGNFQGDLFFETFSVSSRPVLPQTHCSHRIRSCSAPTSCPIFSLYLEVAVDRQGKAGHTKTIEDALVQVMEGHSGLMAKILYHFDTDFEFCVVPIIVTTAELFEARFDEQKTSLRSGTIMAADLKLVDLPFCAVTYRANDNLAIKSPYNNITGGRGNIQQDISQWLTRTVFVVQSESIVQFLSWLDANIFETRKIVQ